MIRMLARGLVVVAVVAGIILGAAAVLPLVMPVPDRDVPEYPEFDTSVIVTDPAPATGTIEADSTVADAHGVVVIDASHANRFDRADVQPLIEAINRVGYDVRIHSAGPLEEELGDADAFVVIDPASAYTGDDLDAVDQFVADGGRLLVLAEPDRIEQEVGVVRAELVTVESEVDEIGQRFGVAFDTRFVYDMETNDGNYKRPVVSPTGDASISPVDDNLADVDEVSLYTAAAVRPTTAGGDVVLETSSTAQLANADEQDSHPVAVRNGNVLAIGDSTFVRADRHTVGDNNVFLAHVVEFLVAGDRQTTAADWDAGTRGDGGTDAEEDDGGANDDVEDG